MEQYQNQAFYTTKELASRWKVHQRPLLRWRENGDGPRYCRINGLVRYAYTDVLNFEAHNEFGGKS